VTEARATALMAIASCSLGLETRELCVDEGTACPPVVKVRIAAPPRAVGITRIPANFEVFGAEPEIKFGDRRCEAREA
jgi:hypothetical protein